MRNNEDKWNDNEDDEDDYEEAEAEGSDFIDVKDVIERAENLPLSSYFLETRKNAKRRSAMSWLESCDPDTIDLIKNYGKKVVEKDFEETKDSQAEENTSKDIFDSQDSQFEENETHSDEEDFYSLVILLLAWENNNMYVNNNNVPPAAFTLGKYSAIEILKRHGIVKAKGNGTLLSTKTEYILTNKCEKMSKRELTAALKAISETNKK